MHIMTHHEAFQTIEKSTRFQNFLLTMVFCNQSPDKSAHEAARLALPQQLGASPEQDAAERTSGGAGGCGRSLWLGGAIRERPKSAAAGKAKVIP